MPYWKASGSKVKWKLRIFNAIIGAKLLYGLETIHLTKALLNKIDAFQVRGLRKILKLPSTFIDRRFTNRNVLDRVSALMFGHHHHNPSILFSHCYNERRAKLLGHIARTSQQDPLRQVSFQPDSVNRIQYGKNVMVDPGKIGCITPSNTYLKKNFNAIITKKLYRMIRTY